MPTLLRRPRFWLVAQMLLFPSFGHVFGLLSLQEAADSESYLVAARMPFQDLLGYHRTAGYPLLMKAFAAVSPGFRIMPWVHLALLYLAVVVLDTALRRYGASPWQAFAVSSGFLFAAWQNQAVSYLLTDFAAMVMAVMTVGFLFWVTAAPRRPLPWIGLTTCLAFSYHIRPAYLFLVPLVPLLGILLIRIRTRRAGKPSCWKQFAVVQKQQPIAISLEMSFGTPPHPSLKLQPLQLHGHQPVVAPSLLQRIIQLAIFYRVAERFTRALTTPTPYMLTAPPFTQARPRRAAHTEIISFLRERSLLALRGALLTRISLQARSPLKVSGILRLNRPTFT